MGEGCAKSSWVTNQHFCCRFSPHQQEVCDENYKKKCTIVFITQSQTEMVRSLVLNPRAKFAICLSRCESAIGPWRSVAQGKGWRSAGRCTSPPAPPSMWRRSLASSSATPAVRSYLLRFVGLGAALRRGRRSATTRRSTPRSISPRNIATSAPREFAIR